MEARTVRDAAAVVAAGAGVLLLADLSLGWWNVRVAVAGVVNVTAAATGWGQVGTIAGLLTVAMLVYMIRPLRNDGTVNLPQAAVTAVLGVSVFGFTVARAFTGLVSVTTPETAVQVQSTSWAAYLGIALAGVVAAATAVALVMVMRGATMPSGMVASSSQR